jgi:hypothetical protein
VPVANASAPAIAGPHHHHHGHHHHHALRRPFGLFLPLAGININYGSVASTGPVGEPVVTGSIPRCRTRSFVVPAEAGGTSTVTVSECREP